MVRVRSRESRKYLITDHNFDIVREVMYQQLIQLLLDDGKISKSIEVNKRSNYLKNFLNKQKEYRPETLYKGVYVIIEKNV